ncbi:MAG: sensor histidine kinase [Spirochaetales bacterium]|nr:sensor histidine kinase [Spirochaetales bacterium]
MFNIKRLKPFIAQILLISLFIITVATNISAMRRIILNTIESDLIPLEAKTLEATTNYFINMKLKEATLISNSRDLTRWRTSTKTPQDFKSLSEQLKSTKDFIRLDYADANSEIVYQFEGTAVQMEKSNPRDNWYYSLLNRNSNYSVEIFHDSLNNQMITYINIKVYDNESLEGILGVGFEYQELFTFLRETSSQSVSFYLIDKEGNIKFHPDQSLITDGNIYNWTGVESREDKNLNKKNKIIMQEYISSLDLSLIVEFDKKAMVKKLLPLFFNRSLIFILLAFITISILLFANNRYRRDIAKSREALSKELETKNMFFHLLTHNVKNALNMILNSGYTLFEEKKDPQTQELSRSIITSTQYINELISNILSTSIIDEGKYSAFNQELSVSEFTENLREFFKQKLEKKHQTLEIFSELETITTDKAIFKQIIFNLTDNAIKYSPANSNIAIKFLEKGKDIAVQICDGGPGFSKEDATSIYKKFARLSARPTDGEKSIGLGLYIAKKLCDVINAKLELIETSEKGSTFEIKVPKKNI